MVRVGFIVEGDTEKILIESRNFMHWLTDSEIELIRPVLNAKGGGNLLPQNIEPMILQLMEKKAHFIVILTDLEYDTSEEAVLLRIGTQHTDLIYIAVKAIEAWFLADTDAMNKWLKTSDFSKDIANNLNKRGPGNSKPVFAKKMIEHYGFLVQNAAQHKHCPSAKKFRDALLLLGHK
jgi:hypothetical protein